MNKNKSDAYFDPASLGIPAPGKAPKKKGGGLLIPAAVVVGVLAVMAVSFYTASYFMGRRAAGASVGAITEASDDDVAKRELTAFVEKFLLNYYNYSAGQYEQAVQSAESMMTPAFQAVYNDRAEDMAFKQKLIGYRVSTDGIRILPGSMAIGSQGNHYLIQLAGTMTFSTGINGATGDFPLSLLISVYRTSTGFQVDNVERLR